MAKSKRSTGSRGVTRKKTKSLKVTSSKNAKQSERKVYVALKPMMPSGFTASQRAKLREYEKRIIGNK
ncbi:MAG: hypothetical protein LUG99_10830 [Lachnospiraceae bacterium]|nr:hypothetical protein [Lachnospiraceae bacterium]